MKKKSKNERGIFPRKVKGFRDIDASLNELRWKIINAASKVYKSYGFEHWDTPVLEYADNLGKYMPDEDTVDKGVYSFKNPEEEPVLNSFGEAIRDKDGQAIMENAFLSLRYDLTAPLARIYAEMLLNKYQRHQLNQIKPDLFRRYQFGPVFRYEIKLTPGRFREFWQLDFDSVGTEDVGADAEICMVLSDALEAIGLKRGSYVINMNNRKVLKGFLQSCGVLDENLEQDILRVFDKLDKIGWEAMELELGQGRTDTSGAEVKGLQLNPPLIAQIMEFLRSFDKTGSRKSVLEQLARSLADNPVAGEGLEELKKIDAILDALGFDETRVRFDPTLIRGMAYYTGPVFEVESLQSYTDEKGIERKVGSICGGGRYDGLIQNLLGIKVPATGASIGVDRLAELLRLTHQAPAKADGPVLIGHLDDDLTLEYQRIARELRARGIETEVYYGYYKGFRKMNKQLKYADEKNCPLVILIGGNEAAKGVATIKDLKLGRQLADTISDKKAWNARVQKEVPIAELADFIVSELNKTGI